MASGPITSWQTDGETMKIVRDFIFLNSKITADGDCSHEIKRRLLLERKVMTNLDSILKSRDITLSIKVHLVKAMVFPVVMYGCERWTTKKAEHWRIDAFELWCWTRLLRAPWTQEDQTSQPYRKSVLNIHWKDWCWSWNSNTLATWWEELTHWKRPWCWERLGAGGEEDDRGWDGWMASLTRWPWACKLWEFMMDREARRAAAHGVTKSQTHRVTQLILFTDTFMFVLQIKTPRCKSKR